ncbi:MAG: purine-binding chemotaxis protein CheW [Pirellulaceae bacterium]|nr:purine-binding chemotaxis protein CheW [Pirellulaceae bacterium]
MSKTNSMALNSGPVDSASDQNILQFVGFKLGGKDYAFPIDQTREIVELRSITPTPDVPEHIVGVTNLRGQIIPIVDLQRVLTPGAPATPSRHAVVVDVCGQLTGCLVDSVTRVVRLPQSEIQTADDILDQENARSVDGFAKYEGTILIVLDASRVIARC